MRRYAFAFWRLDNRCEVGGVIGYDSHKSRPPYKLVFHGSMPRGCGVSGGSKNGSCNMDLLQRQTECHRLLPSKEAPVQVEITVGCVSG